MIIMAILLIRSVWPALSSMVVATPSTVHRTLIFRFGHPNEACLTGPRHPA